MHTETVLSARLGLVHVCLRPPCWKQEAKIQAQISQILSIKRESVREREFSFQHAMIDQKKVYFLCHISQSSLCACVEQRQGHQQGRGDLSIIYQLSGCRVEDYSGV